MTSRRQFLLGTVAAALPGFVPADRSAPRVEAIPTVFHGHPDGQTTLVRFVVTGVDAPAARLRVLGANGRLLGTAGLVRRGDLLAGELWVPLTRATTLRSHLETLVTRGVHRTSHRITPTTRWTIRWLTLADPGALRDRFATMSPLLLGAEAEILTSAGVRLNPWRAAPEARDHLDLLRIAVPAARLSAVTGIPLSARALVPEPDRSDRFVRAALAASGVAGIVEDRAQADPAALGLDAGRARMAPLVEVWLAEQVPGTTRGPTVTVLGTDPGFAARALRTIEEWNGRYAYPHIVTGEGESPGLALPARSALESSPPSSDLVPDPGPVHGASMFTPLARLTAAPSPTLAGLAQRFALPTAGILVFNPSPFGRSDVVELPGGALRIVTSVPGLGYAFEPDGAGAGGQGGIGAAPLRETLRPIQSAYFSAQLDERTGGLASLVNRETGRDLVAPGGAFNTLDDCVLGDAWVERYEGVGVRLIGRRAGNSGALTSRVTIYDAFPWVDLENSWDASPPRDVDWRFDVSHASTTVTREVAGGSVTGTPPLDRAPILRWLALGGDDQSVLLGTARPAAVTVTPGASLTVHGAGTHFRLRVHRGFLLPDDPWRFGFAMAPLVAVSAPGSGPMRLPTFGRLLDVVDPAVAVVGVKDADDGVGLVVYLMDLGGSTRDVVLRPGVLAFDDGVALDLAEREREPLRPALGGGVLIALDAGGYAAVRLLGVRLAG